MQVKAVCFDLYGTLAQVEKSISDRQASDFLVSRGFEVYPQAFKAAWHYVSFVDYPKYGFKSWRSELKRVLQRLGVKVDVGTLRELVELYKTGIRWTRFPDVVEAVSRAKEAGLKTAIVTTIPRFRYRKALKPILGKIDVLADGYTFRCEKSNPKIYLKTLEVLGVKAGEAVMIGDDMELDIRLPKKIGMKAILLDRTGKLSREDCMEAVAVVRDLNEALEEVLKLRGES